MKESIPPPLPQQPPKDGPSTDLKNAAQVMLLYAFFLALPVAIVVATSNRAPDAFGVAILSVVSFCITLFVTAGVLLLKRKKAGLILAWTAIPLMLLSVPIGTLAGVFVVAKLKKPSVRNLFS